MSHACPDCGMVCCCDMEDHDQPQPEDCTHVCAESDDFDYEKDGGWLEHEVERLRSSRSDPLTHKAKPNPLTESEPFDEKIEK